MVNRNFSALPLETKRSYEIPELGQRGYVSLEQNIKGRKEGDLKEFWHFGQYVCLKYTLQNILKMLK
jgi:isopenicillin N synthase-like dioxygenase